MSTINLTDYLASRPTASKNLSVIVSSFRLVMARLNRPVTVGMIHGVIITTWYETRCLGFTRERGSLDYIVGSGNLKVSYLGLHGNNRDDTVDGDAWVFRGFGWCQLTFRTNYERAFRIYRDDCRLPTFGSDSVGDFLSIILKKWIEGTIDDRACALAAISCLCSCHVASAHDAASLISLVTGRGEGGLIHLDQRLSSRYF